MGFTLPWLDVPVVKITNCLLAPSANELGEPQEEQSCIRCSACADACPADLCRNSCTGSAKVSNTIKLPRITLPTALNVGLARGFARAIFPLVQYFRQEKLKLRLFVRKKSAAEAKARFEARPARLEREKRLALNDIRAQPFNLQPKIKMRLLPLWRG